MNVLLFDRLSAKSWSGSEAIDAPSFPCLPLADALQKKTIGELLIVGYGHATERTFPRLNKAALARFASDPEVTLNAILVDVDYEGHQVPPPEWHEEVIERVPWPCAWYRTPHGLRLVWEASEPIPLSLADSALEWVHLRLNEAGVETDIGTRDWTRMQRCPFAFEHDLPHSDLTDIPSLEIPREGLEVASARMIGSFVQCKRPESLESLTRRELNSIAKYDSNLAEDLYRGQLAAVEGERHAKLLRTALIISHVMESNDPRVPYRMLHESATSMGKGLDELWRICEWSAASYDASKKEDAAELQEAKERSAELLNCHAEQVRQRVVLDSGKDFYVWDENEGVYSKGYINQRQLLAALKAHSPVLAGDVIWAKEPVADILRDFSSPVSRVVYSYTADGSSYNPRTQELMLPCAPRDRTLKPVYNEAIDEWFQALFGEYYDKALDWMAAYPRLDRPVCALYFRGARSVGKGMLALGLARIFSEYHETTAYAEVVGNYQESFIRAPLILADEKVAQNNYSPNDSSVFRRIVGNGVHSLNPKHKTPVTLLGYPRVLITANNDDALKIREDLDQDDLDAVKLRVGYIDREGCTEAVDYLREKARELGHSATYEMTKEWVARGIAEHVLWLEENHEYQAGDRFLVEGWESDFTRSLVTSAGSAGLVAETLVLAIERGVYTDAVRWFDFHVYVNDSELAKNWKQIRGHEVDQPPGSNSRLKALRSLAEGKQKRIVDSQGRQKRYWMIPGTTMARLAEERNLVDYDHIAQACARTKEEEDTTGLQKPSLVDMSSRI